MKKPIIVLLILIFILTISIFFKNRKQDEPRIAFVDWPSTIYVLAKSDYIKSGTKINLDSLDKVFNENRTTSPDSGFEFANELRTRSELVLKGAIALQKIIELENIDKKKAEDLVKWNKTKAGKIQKKHPDWSVEDCERIANREIWIGMTLTMLKFERGLPNSANPSDFGSGRQWQWCWYDFKPSCFYGGDDEIITSYN